MYLSCFYGTVRNGFEAGEIFYEGHPEMALSSLVAISGPIKVSISRALPMPLEMDLVRVKIIMYRAISTTATSIVITFYQ